MPRPVSVSLAALAAVLSFSAAPAAVPPAGPGPAAETLLLRAPTIGGGRIVFATPATSGASASPAATRAASPRGTARRATPISPPTARGWPTRCAATATPTST